MQILEGIMAIPSQELGRHCTGKSTKRSLPRKNGCSVEGIERGRTSGTEGKK